MLVSIIYILYIYYAFVTLCIFVNYICDLYPCVTAILLRNTLLLRKIDNKIKLIKLIAISLYGPFICNIPAIYPGNFMFCIA